jgi:peptide subunit release factor 1 (eRF1)
MNAKKKRKLRKLSLGKGKKLRLISREIVPVKGPRPAYLVHFKDEVEE